MQTSCLTATRKDRARHEVCVIIFSFPLGTEMFHFPRFPPHDLCIQSWARWLHQRRLPHSEIPGSKVASHLPEAYRRLRRPSSAHFCQAIHRTPLCASAIRMRDPTRVVPDSPGVYELLPRRSAFAHRGDLIYTLTFVYFTLCLARMTSHHASWKRKPEAGSWKLEPEISCVQYSSVVEVPALSRYS